MVEEDHKQAEMVHSSSEKPMELDLYIDRLRLALEYQGEHHYKPVYRLGYDFATQQQRDKEKQDRPVKRYTLWLSS